MLVKLTLGIYSDSDPPLKSILLIATFSLLQNFGLLICWVFVAAYLRELVLVCVPFVMVVIYLTLETILFQWRSQNKRNAAMRGKVPNVDIEKEINSCFWTAIFTSWVSPCSVWLCVNKSEKRKVKYYHKVTSNYFLLSSSIASLLSVSLCVGAIYTFLRVQNGLSDNLPITHCHFSLLNSTNSIACSLAQNDWNVAHLKACLYICDDFNCSSVHRVCSSMEKPTDLFFNTVGPILYSFLFVSFLSSFCLQVLGNYHNLYKLTKKLPFLKPIIHPTVMVDILDWKVSDQKAKTLIEEASVDTINFSDPITGDS